MDCRWRTPCKVAATKFDFQRALQKGIDVMFVTERAVFKMTKRGIAISEVAPGIDLNKDILPNIPFPINIPETVKAMDSRLFREGPMDIKDEILRREKN